MSVARQNLKVSAHGKSQCISPLLVAKLEDDRVAYWLRSELITETDKRGLIYEVDRRIETGLELDLQNGTPLTAAVKSQVYSKIIVTQCKHRSFPAAFAGIPGFLFVNAPVRAIVEKLEPGIHEFVPLHIDDRTGQVTEPMFLLHFRTRIQAVIINKSDGVYAEQRPLN
jgi:hypothetical protein